MYAEVNPKSEEKVLLKHAIILESAPGGGKDHVCRLVEQHFYVVNMKRLLLRHYPDLSAITKIGKLANDDLVLNVLNGHLDEVIRSGNTKTGLILNGVPRTTNQAFGVMDKLWSIFNREHRVATVHLKVDPEVATLRQLTRKEEEEQRDDKDPEVIKERMIIYEENSRGVKVHLMRHTKWYDIDANQSKESVRANFNDVVREERERLGV